MRIRAKEIRKIRKREEERLKAKIKAAKKTPPAPATPLARPRTRRQPQQASS